MTLGKFSQARVVPGQRLLPWATTLPICQVFPRSSPKRLLHLLQFLCNPGHARNWNEWISSISSPCPARNWSEVWISSRGSSIILQMMTTNVLKQTDWLHRPMCLGGLGTRSGSFMAPSFLMVRCLPPKARLNLEHTIHVVVHVVGIFGGLPGGCKTKP